METRNFEVRVADEEKREVEGVAVPYGQTIDVGGLRERFVRGAFTDTDVPLLWQHGEPIGKVRASADTDAGLMIRATISKTPRGDEAMTLLRDGVVGAFSVGFVPEQDSRDEDGTVVRERATLKEVSVVTFPAYSDAKVLAVRNEDQPDNPTTEEVQEDPMADEPTPLVDVEARDQIADLERRMSTMSTTTATPVDPSSQFRSFGHWVQAVAAGDEDAVALHRAFAGGVAGATVAAPDPIVKNAWVLESIKLLDFGRPSMNAFRQIPLPGEGMNVEYPVVQGDTMTVAQQANEADALTFGKITLASQTAPVSTYGGYTAMSRQAIERSSYGYVDTAMRALVIAYTKATNAAFVTALKGGAGYGTATAAATNAGWIDAVAQSAVQIYKGAGLHPQFILSSPEVFEKIVKLVDGTDRGTVAASNPMNNTGSANVPGLSASLLGLPVIVDPALAAADCFIAHSEGVTTFESPGAPFRLTDEDNVTLTKDFSIYGYLAFAVTNPKAVVKVTVS